MKLDCTPHINVNKVIEDLIDRLEPNIVFTHFWGDVNMDHLNVYKSTLVAVLSFPDLARRFFFL